MKNPSARMQSFLDTAVENHASDLHLSVGHPPVLRIARELVPLAKEGELSTQDMQELMTVLLSKQQQERLLKERDIDFSTTFQGKARFRVNVYYQRDVLSVAFRYIPAEIKTIEDLNLPKVIHQFTDISQGFVLITGPSSHGKSTTMAALIDEINHAKAKHIITIEDPIEFVFTEDQSIIDQREIYKDALSFSRALRATFRQDPDVIMVGEMRDPETIATAITAAETGHLVFATLHTNSAAQTIDRIVDSFPPGQQAQIRSQLSASLSGVISQRLIPRTKGGLIPAIEILLATSAVRNLIRENKTHEIPFAIDTSGEMGMISLDRSLATLVNSGEITLESALAYSTGTVGELKTQIKKGK